MFDLGVRGGVCIPHLFIHQVSVYYALDPRDQD